jgi:spermidine dehydrogenase
MTNEAKLLGMDRAITRRDFLNGVAMTAAGAAIAGTGLPAFAADTKLQPIASPTYPPRNTGLMGSSPAALKDFPGIYGGKYASVAMPAVAEEYDLVIVGGGISGLSAAHFYRQGLGTKQKILILDNHADFGGHAKRNEFEVGGKTYVSVGGTLGIATPFPYSYGAKALIKELGIDVTRSGELSNHVLDTQYKLGSGMFFNKESFLEDKMVLGFGRSRPADFLAKAPLSDAARTDLARIYGTNPDYLAGMSPEEKVAKLKHMSYQDYLLKVAKISPDAIPFFAGTIWRNSKHVDTVPAYEAAEHGSPGFNGLGLKLGENYNEGSYVFHFPDGNASVARLLVGKLVPSAYAAPQNMDTIVQAKLDYSQLDLPSSPMRIRLGSTVVRVQNDGGADSPTGVTIAYEKDGKLTAVRGKYCILACYNKIIPALVPELPAVQKKALQYPVKVPILYTNVLIRNWTAFQKLGVSRISAPGMYYNSMNIDTGSLVGGYQAVGEPDQPVVIHLTRSPNKPGLATRKEQNAAGAEELLTMSFADHELVIRKQFQRILGGSGFNAADDILAITVNRWPYGYAYTYDTLGDPEVPEEERPHVLGRKRFGRITIANSDAGAAAFTNQAMDEAARAVEELYLLQGLR